MTRRTFLTVASAAIASRALGQGEPKAGESKKRPLKKAVNLGMVKGPKDASTLDKFRMVKDAGFDGIELNRPDALPLDELLKARDATGLEVAGLICSTHWGKPLSDNDPKVREQAFEGIKLSLADAAELGCARLLLVPGVVKKDVPYDVCWQRSQEGIRRVVEFAERAKCKIAIENVWNQFIMSPLEAARFVDEIGSPWVGWHFDIGNVINYGWPEQWVRILGPRILNLHIKEFSRKKRDAEGLWKGFAVELGEGDDNWPAIMQALDEIHYAGWGILEVPGGDAARLQFLAERSDKLFAS